MLNFIAIHLVSYLVRGPLQEPTKIFLRLHAQPFARYHSSSGNRSAPGFLIAVTMALVLWWFFLRTAAGFRVRAVCTSRVAGGAPDEWQLKNVRACIMASGALAASGSIEVSGSRSRCMRISRRVRVHRNRGCAHRGTHPAGVIASGVLFGALQTGALALQREFAVPSSLASVAEAALILAALVFAAYRGRAIIGLSRQAAS